MEIINRLHADVHPMLNICFLVLMSLSVTLSLSPWCSILICFPESALLNGGTIVHPLSWGMTSGPVWRCRDSRALIEYDELFSGSPLATSGLYSRRWETEEEISRFSRLLKCKAAGESDAANARARIAEGPVCPSASAAGDAKVIPHVRGSWPPIAYDDTRCLPLCSLCAYTFII